MEKKNVWSTSDIVANRNNWSLAADVELLKHLQSLSEKILAKANASLQSLNSFENDVNQTCISIANTSNKFKSLSDTQFIESKVQEENSDLNEQLGSQNETPDNRENQNITVKLKEALENGFQVLDTQYDVIPVSGSDSEDDGPEEILLRARNPYLSRRLPHIIGSEEFTRNDNLGLIDSSSEEEDEEEEEDDDEDDDTDDDEEKAKKPLIDSDEDSISIQKSPSPKKEFLRPRTQIIRISSSDSEESDVSIPCDRSNVQEKVSSENKKKPVEISKENDNDHNPSSFAEHLNAALKNNPRNIYSIVPPDFGDTFSPPPFPGANNDVSSEGDGDSEDDGDIFSTKKNTKHSIRNTNYKSNYGDESDDDDDWNTEKTGGVTSQKSGAPGEPSQSTRKSSIVSKTSQHSDTSSSSKDSHVTSDKSGTQSLPKSKIVQPNTNPMNKRMAAAINAELSAKLNLKNPSNKSSENLTSAKTSIKSTESRTPVETPPAKSSENTTPVKSAKPKVTDESIQSTTSKTESKHTAMFEKIDDENSSENDDDEDDLFKGISVAKKTASQNKKTKGLFGDDDNMDNLFSPVKSTRSVAKKSSDLFSSESTSSKPVKLDETVDKPAAKPPVVDLLKKTSDLFASDSESEDDIFSIIKGQKKVDTDIFKTKTDDMLENSFSGSKPTTNSNKETPPTVDSISKSDPLQVKSSSLFIEEQLPFQKASINSTNSSEQSITTKRNDVINVAPSSVDDLFETVKKTTADLFQSDSNDDGDDLFGKKLNSDRQTTSVSKSADLFTDTSEAEKSKTDIISSTESVSNSDDVTKKSEPDQSTSSESLNETEKPSLLEKNTIQSDKVNDIIATIRSPKLSSSSSSDTEDEKKQNTFAKVSDASKKDENEKSVARPSRNEDDLFDELSYKNDLFSEYGKFATGVKSSNNNNDDVSSSAKEDIFGATYETRSAIFSPPKDDLSDGFSEDDDIKESNYLSQEDDDLFGEKFEPPPFRGGMPDDNTFEEQQKKSLTADVAVVDDLFAKSTSSLPVSDLVFHETDLFSGQKRDSDKDKKLPGNTSSEKSWSENSNSNTDSKNPVLAGSKDEFNKDDSIQKPLVSNERKLHSPDNVPSTSESKDDISNASKKSRSLFFTEKELFDSDSDESDVIANKTTVPISPPSKIIAPKEIDQTTPSSPSKDEKSNENLEDNSATKKTSPSSKMDKISPAVFDKYDDAAGKRSKDEQDGNLFAKSASSEPVLPVRNTPGKLAMSRGLNINVNALLPGSNWSSKNKQKQTTEQVTSDEKRDSEPAAIPNKTLDVSEKPSALLNNVIKERAKVTGKRRPPSRQARISRILTEDVFGGSGFGTESFQEEEKSNVSSESPKNREEVRVDESKKSEKEVTLKDDLFGDDEGKIDDLFGISRSKKEPTIEKPSVITNKAVSNVSNSLQGIDIDLNLDINPSLNRLPNLTKDRAKPQKRPSQPKKTPTNVASAVVEEPVTSAESTSKPDAEKLDARVEKSSSLSNSSKQDVSSSVIHSAKSIFDSLEDDDDGDDDLFENSKSKKIIEEKSAATKAEVKVETMKPSPQSNQQPVVTKPKTNSKINIFNDDDEGDELFGSAKRKLSANKLSKKSSLFEDNDDDDLFGAKTSTSSGRMSTAPATTSLKTKPLNEKPRILKLRSETVQKDPLTGKDLSGPL